MKARDVTPTGSKGPCPGGRAVERAGLPCRQHRPGHAWPQPRHAGAAALLWIVLFSGTVPAGAAPLTAPLPQTAPGLMVKAVEGGRAMLPAGIPAAFGLHPARPAAARPAAPARHIAAQSDNVLTTFGSAMKYGLPLIAAACAARQGRIEDFAARAVLQTALVLGGKHLLADHPIARRPTGEGKGFPSGHTASAFFGAADLAGKCLPDQPAAGAAVYGGAVVTGFSRVQAGQHTNAQVFSGALVGISFGAASFGIGTDNAAFSIGLKF